MMPPVCWYVAGKHLMILLNNVQATLSSEKKLCVMLYDEGTCDHMLLEEKIFKDSSIYC